MNFKYRAEMNESSKLCKCHGYKTTFNELQEFHWPNIVISKLKYRLTIVVLNKVHMYA